MTKNQMKCGIIYEKIVMQADDDERKHLLLFTVSVRDQAHIFLITKNKNRLNIVTLTFFNVSLSLLYSIMSFGGSCSF